MKYGDKRDFPKIDIYLNGQYIATTTWSRTCKEAKGHFIAQHNHSQESVECRRAR